MLLFMLILLLLIAYFGKRWFIKRDKTISKKVSYTFIGVSAFLILISGAVDKEDAAGQANQHSEKLEELTENVLSLEEQNEELKEKLTNSEENVDKLEEEFKDIEKENEKLKTENEKLTKQVKSLEAKEVKNTKEEQSKKTASQQKKDRLYKF